MILSVSVAILLNASIINFPDPTILPGGGSSPFDVSPMSKCYNAPEVTFNTAFVSEGKLQRIVLDDGVLACNYRIFSIVELNVNDEFHPILSREPDGNTEFFRFWGLV
jgi:hypothetical protein|tara:strand:- start:5215 stop:5538 length:324 start_codon:yes stop_codon:yes gene_type:complete